MPGDTRERLPDEKRSLRFTFFITSIILVFATGWAIYDESAHRRPWREYQRQFNHLDYAMALADYQKAKASFDSPEIRQKYRGLQEELAKAEAGLTSPAHREAEAKLAKLERDLAQKNQEIQFLKSELDEEYYWIDKAIYARQDPAPLKAKAEKLEKRIHTLQPGYDTLFDQVKTLKADLKKQKEAVEKVRDQVKVLEAPVTGAERRLDAIRGRYEELKQVVLQGLEVNVFGEPILRVDRCTTCHLAIDRPGFEKVKQPFRTHPHLKELLKTHPIGRFGCTSCHQGQGPALEVEEAHGFAEHWDFPLLKGELIQASCRTCHVDQDAIPVAPGWSHGHRLVAQLGCFGCHNLRGFEHAEKVAPDLTKIRAKADPGWLVRWIMKPRDYLPKTRMPFFGLSEHDATSIAAYLLKASEDFPEMRGLGVKGGDPAKGRNLVMRVGCLGCHRVDGLEPPAPAEGTVTAAQAAEALEKQMKEEQAAAAPPEGGEAAKKPEGAPAAPAKAPPLHDVPPPPPQGTDFAPDLSQVASKIASPEWLVAWLKDPKKFRPTTKMPNLRLADDEARHIAAFLLTLGQKQVKPGLGQELAKPERIKEGERLILKRGCSGCHDIKGFETAQKVAPDLSDFGHKRVLTLFFGEAVNVPQTWEDFTFNKLKNPPIYATERVEQIMPNFGLTDDQIVALRVLLKSQVATRVSEKYLRRLTPEEKAVQVGRRIVWERNCNGCHVVEAQGGAILRYYRENQGPPLLEIGALHEGEKVQATWLYQFLGRPVPIRPWLDVRMPTFGLSIDDATWLTHYFAAVGGQKFPYEYVLVDPPAPDMVKAGVKLATKDYFDCFNCHQQGSRKPEGPPEGWAPDLGMAQRRLRPEWIVKWLSDPQKIQPGTKMPSFFPGGPDDILGGDANKQIRALSDYLMTLGER